MNTKRCPITTHLRLQLNQLLHSSKMALELLERKGLEKQSAYLQLKIHYETMVKEYMQEPHELNT